jgi:hypothetical protein
VRTSTSCSVSFVKAGSSSTSRVVSGLTAAPAYAGIAAVAAGARLLSLMPLERLERVVELGRPKTPRSPAQTELTAERVERVLFRSKTVLRHTCLTRGITRYFFLRRAGADVRLIFGLSKMDGRHVGHCWIVRDGEIYAEASEPLRQFTDVYVLPSH